jgi:hypothetical protein
MTMFGMRMVSGALLGVAAVGSAWAQNAEKPAYLNPNLPAEQRAADLVGRMTLEEKASQLVNQARPIPRLGVPGYDWWSEALHGVANTTGVTSFPEPIGLAATFDAPRIHEMAVATGTEARVVHDKAVEANGDTPIFRGLDFWAPNLNIFRDPRWAGDVRRGSVFDRADGRGICDRDAGGRSALLPCDFNAEAFCRALGARADPTLYRCGREQARRAGYLHASISRGGDRGEGGQRDVRLQRHQRSACVRE